MHGTANWNGSSKISAIKRLFRSISCCHISKFLYARANAALFLNILKIILAHRSTNEKRYLTIPHYIEILLKNVLTFLIVFPIFAECYSIHIYSKIFFCWQYASFDYLGNDSMLVAVELHKSQRLIHRNKANKKYCSSSTQVTTVNNIYKKTLEPNSMHMQFNCIRCNSIANTVI